MNVIERFALTLGLSLAVATPLGARAAEPATSLAPVFAASEGWLNGDPSAASVRNKVVVVDVFTFGCYNCKNVVPNLRALEHREQHDVVIIGVHSPETPYEKIRANVADNLKAQGITWPVALDTTFTIWNAYGVSAWPTQLFFDRHGRLRKTIVGDSQDDDVGATIERLLAER